MGLGGVANWSSGGGTSGEGRSGSAPTTQKPLDTDVPEELRSLVLALGAQLKANKEAADEAGLASRSGLVETAASVQRAGLGLGAVGARVETAGLRATAVKESARAALRGGELSERRGETLPSQCAWEQRALAQLLRQTEGWEASVGKLASDLAQLQQVAQANAASNQPRSQPSYQDLTAHLHRMEEVYRFVQARVQGVSDATKVLSVLCASL